MPKHYKSIHRKVHFKHIILFIIPVHPKYLKSTSGLVETEKGRCSLYYESGGTRGGLLSLENIIHSVHLSKILILHFLSRKPNLLRLSPHVLCHGAAISFVLHYMHSPPDFESAYFLPDLQH